MNEPDVREAFEYLSGVVIGLRISHEESERLATAMNRLAIAVGSPITFSPRG